MLIIRRVGTLVLVAAAVGVYFFLAPKTQAFPTPPKHQAAINSVQSEYNSNNAGSQYIYGQIFAGTTATKDMLDVIARENDDELAQNVTLAKLEVGRQSDKRIPAELVLVVLGLGLLLATSSDQLNRPPVKSPAIGYGSAGSDGPAAASG